MGQAQLTTLGITSLQPSQVIVIVDIAAWLGPGTSPGTWSRKLKFAEANINYTMQASAAAADAWYADLCGATC